MGVPACRWCQAPVESPCDYIRRTARVVKAAEYVTATLDFLKQLDLIGELREFAQLAATEVHADVLAAIVLYLLPLAWLIRRWRRGGLLAVLGGVVRLFILALMLMFAVVALLVRLEGRTYRW